MVHSFEIPETCFAVENGHLLQNPLSWGCMSFINVSIVSLYVLTICFIPVCLVVNKTILPCVKKIGSIFSKKFNCSRFYYQGQYTEVPVQKVTGDSMKWKVKNKDELNDKYLYPKPFKVKKHFRGETSV